MVLKFATKRNQYGNRKGLEINLSKKTFIRNYDSWHSDEYIEIKNKDREKLIEQLEAFGFIEE